MGRSWEVQELLKIVEHNWGLQSCLAVRCEVVCLVEVQDVAAELGGFVDLDRRWVQHFGFSETVTCHDGVLRLLAVVLDIAVTGLVLGYLDAVEVVEALADVHCRVVHTESAAELAEDAVECPLGDDCTPRLEEVDSEVPAMELEHPIEVLAVH
jgi:hypothetical protein